MKNKLTKLIVLLLAIVVILFSGLIYFTFFAPNYFEGEIVIKVSKGMTFGQVAESLKANNVIKNRTLFEIAGKIISAEKDIKIGKYLFISRMTNLEILDDLKSGKSALRVSVTIREGLKATQQAKIYTQQLGIDSAKFVEFVFDESFAKKLGADGESLEGYLMPDTYQFYWQADEEEIIERMVEQFWKVYNDTFQQRAKILGLSNNEIITMASIVEVETDLDSERATIAGVYYNRLRKRIFLQADPTIQYVIEDGPRRLRYSDLKIESPYNTYRYFGLPPGPINNPGKASILAALYPAKHKYIFFVATGFEGHTFTRTYSEHQRAVSQFRKNKTARQQNKEAGLN
ncbi:MAG: endolytic transglycosylase MltG [Bacteroidota bacterium]|nr:endolytic transglycosylase MltG [Bacteroidota bacterium]